MENENKKPYKIKDVTRNIKKAVVANTLEEVRIKSAEKFGKIDLPNIHLDSDGTEIDDEDYFQTLEANAELIVVFPGEEWIDPTTYVTITTHRDIVDTTDSCDVEKIHLKKLVGQLKNNLCNVSVLSEPDLELLSNMDPNSLTDITGKDFIEQLKEASGRILHDKRQAVDAIELLKLLGQKYPLEQQTIIDITPTDAITTPNTTTSTIPTTTFITTINNTQTIKNEDAFNKTDVSSASNLLSPDVASKSSSSAAAIATPQEASSSSTVHHVSEHCVDGDDTTILQNRVEGPPAAVIIDDDDVTMDNISLEESQIKIKRRRI